MLIKLAAQTNKRTQILIQTGRGKRQGEQTVTCAVQVQVETQSLINLHYMYSLSRQQGVAMEDETE